MSGLVLIIVSYYCEMEKTIFFYLTVVLIDDKMIDTDSKKTWHGFSFFKQWVIHKPRGETFRIFYSSPHPSWLM